MKSCQLCLKRDGTAKSLGCTYFCHLCQIKSDDIAIENQVPCCLCPEDVAVLKHKCFHHPVTTKRTIEKAIFELERLKTFPIASCLRHCCREHNADSDFHFFYRDACKVHLRNVGRQAGIDDDTKMKKDDYEDLLDDTLSAFGLIDFHHSSELVEKKEVVRKMLNFVVSFRYCFDCIAFEKSVLQSMVEVDNQFPCIFHMHKRILENIMTMVYCLLWMKFQQVTRKPGRNKPRR
jgi:hypothetical protein